MEKVVIDLTKVRKCGKLHTLFGFGEDLKPRGEVIIKGLEVTLGHNFHPNLLLAKCKSQAF